MNNRRILLIIEPILAYVPFIEQVNFYVKVLCGISTLVVAFFAVRAYIIKIKIDRIELKIKEQEYYRMKKEYLEKFSPSEMKKASPSQTGF